MKLCFAVSQMRAFPNNNVSSGLNKIITTTILCNVPMLISSQNGSRHCDAMYKALLLKINQVVKNRCWAEYFKGYLLLNN